MERLTGWDGDRAYICNLPIFEIEAVALDLISAVVYRLAAYEDTGLEPEQVAEVYRRFSEARAIAEELGQKYADRADELLRAEAEGRLLVLPCKVGDTVYVTDGYVRKTKVVAIHQWVSGHWKISIEEPHTTPYWKGYERSFDAFGKTVFLTRAAAEAALAKEDTP